MPSIPRTQAARAAAPVAGTPMIVRARHAAPYRHVPSGQRSEERLILSGFVDADVPEIPPDAFAPIVFPPSDRDWNPKLHVRDGELWEELSLPRGRLGPAEGLGRRAFIDWLDGTEPSLTVVEARLRRTPLVAVHASRKRRDSWESRGLTEEPRSRTVLCDWRERAGRAAARFLKEDVALAGDAVFVRCHPVAALHVQNFMSVQHAPLSGLVENPLVRSIWDRTSPDGVAIKPIAASSAILAALREGTAAGAEARALANYLPGAALLDIEALSKARARQGPTDGTEALDALVRDLHPYADAGCIGTVAGADIPAALSLVAEAARILATETFERRQRWDLVDGHLCSGAVTGIGMRDDDAASLEGLAP